MDSLNRRRFLSRTIAGAAATMLPRVASAQGPASDASRESLRVIDTNVHLFQWPFRRLPFDEVDELAGKLRAHRIDEAWAGSFEGVLQRDLGGVNRRLAEACRVPGRELLVPIGSVNPGLPDWEEDLRRCREEHRMPGVRLHPNYHGYALDDPRFERLLAIAAESGVFVQIAASMEDRRTQHPLMQVPNVDLTSLPGLMVKNPSAKVMILNYKPAGTVLEQFADVPGVSFDTARVEDTHGVARLIRAVGRDCVVFGTHAPFFIYESALIKVHESELSDENKRAVFQGNVERILIR